MAECVGVIEYWCICTAGNVMQIKNEFKQNHFVHLEAG